MNKYKKNMDLIYRNKELISSVQQSMFEAQHGKGVQCNTPEEIDAYFDSL